MLDSTLKMKIDTLASTVHIFLRLPGILNIVTLSFRSGYEASRNAYTYSRQIAELEMNRRAAIEAKLRAHLGAELEV